MTITLFSDYDAHRRGVQKNYEQIKKVKLRNLTELGASESIRDFGGVWGIHGFYLIEAARRLGCSYAEMIDINFTPEYEEMAAGLMAAPTLELRNTRADFSDPMLYGQLEPVDISILYDVLLHQPTHLSTAYYVAGKTQRCIAVAQPVARESVNTMPASCFNLQFYPEELKDRIRDDFWFRKEPAFEAFDTSGWMWGQSVSYLHALFHGFHWSLEHLEIYGVSEYWDYAVMRFVPRA